MCKAVNDFMEDSKKEGKLSAFYDMIKQGVITLDQATKSIDLSKEQLLDKFKEYKLAL